MSSAKAKTERTAPGGATTTDDFLGGRISIVQPSRGHRSGSDAIWLQAAVPAHAGDHILDVGAGVGVAGLALLARVPECKVTALERDPTLCELAERNAAFNGISPHFTVICGDITARSPSLLAKGILREGYDHVMANPPFHSEGTVRTAAEKRAAHEMKPGELEGWLRFMTTAAAPKAPLTLIHRPEALREILTLMQERFGEITIFPLFPKEGAAASRIIVQGRKGTRGAPKLRRGLVLHRSDGSYTDAAEAVLRHGEKLDLAH